MIRGVGHAPILGIFLESREKMAPRDEDEESNDSSVIGKGAGGCFGA